MQAPGRQAGLLPEGSVPLPRKGADGGARSCELRHLRRAMGAAFGAQDQRYLGPKIAKKRRIAKSATDVLPEPPAEPPGNPGAAWPLRSS